MVHADGIAAGNAPAAVRTVREESGQMTAVTVHRMIRYRLLPGKASGYQLLDRILEDQRQLCNAALEERIDCCRKTGKGLTYFRPVQVADRMPPGRFRRCGNARWRSSAAR